MGRCCKRSCLSLNSLSAAALHSKPAVLLCHAATLLSSTHHSSLTGEQAHEVLVLAPAHLHRQLSRQLGSHLRAAG